MLEIILKIIVTQVQIPLELLWKCIFYRRMIGFEGNFLCSMYVLDGNLSIEVINHQKCHFALAIIADPEARLYQSFSYITKYHTGKQVVVKSLRNIMIYINQL